MRPHSVGVLLGGHVHSWEDLAALVDAAEAGGFDAAWVDGDLCMVSSSRDAHVLDGWTLTAALLARTRRIAVGSLRLVHYWNAARLAQAAATAERIAPGRFRFFATIGDRPNDDRFGLPVLPAGERIAWLDETLDAVRALWRGESVTRRGRYVTLDEARLQPPPGRPPAVAVAARRPRMLDVVAAHADVWDVNLPPIRRYVEPAAEELAKACEARGRDPGEISRSMLIFTRVAEKPDPEAARSEFRRLNPWFRWIPDSELGPALVVGAPEQCRERLAELADSLALDHVVLDLAGLDAGATRSLFRAWGPQE